MTRGTETGRDPKDPLENPFPIGHQLPALYHDDDFAQQLCAALDEVWSPLFWVLDNRDAYFDPALSPSDFLEWLASWVGFALDERWSVEQQRSLTADAVQLYQWRGTLRGIRDLLALYWGAEIDVSDSGGISWSTEAGSPLPGSADHRLVVRLPMEAKEEIARVDAIVAAAKPAHVKHVVEVTAP